VLDLDPNVIHYDEIILTGSQNATIAQYETALKLLPKLTDPETRLADMDRMRIDVQVLATFVSQFYYWTDP
jgi:aminocarboxymuconate-semialdehyde decarboxylase